MPEDKGDPMPFELFNPLHGRQGAKLFTLVIETKSNEASETQRED